MDVVMYMPVFGSVQVSSTTAGTLEAGGSYKVKAAFGIVYLFKLGMALGGCATRGCQEAKRECDSTW
jgi:hypothetical protein